MKSFLLSFLAFTTLFIQAQTDSTNQVTGFVNVVVDPAIELLVSNRTQHRIDLLNAPPVRPAKIDGFRVMIGFDPSKTNALRMLSGAEIKYIGYKCVMQYDEPNFKVYVGEFVDYGTASAMVNKLRKSYPLSRVIKDKIRPPEGYFDKLEETAN